jgi:hypothetical protein
MNKESLRALISDDFWVGSRARLKNPETVTVLREVVDYIMATLLSRVDNITAHEGLALMFFSKKREIIRINVGIRDLRIYIHPPSGALFDPDVTFPVDRFNLWSSSFRKTLGKYAGMTAWVTEKKHLAGMKEIIDLIPKG